ncbi:MAG TPA: sigma-70 family RNA polymerase sigma factor [Candidatus Limnocylindria bacterium]|jgi:RNA polymerase sigma-70 factor (ECF subfamily)|nr:sigma-70 family RNA polymerase sigma factor [Candidatus Limnocylindria bacterium]
MNGASGEASALLVEQARRGDARAFEQLAREVERPLYRHALRMVGQVDAEDVVQDALLSAWRSLSSFEGSSFRAWIFRIATNRALDRLRARRRHPEVPLDPPTEEDNDRSWAEPAAPGPDLAEIAGDREALVIVEQILATLPVEQRAALLLRDVEGFAYEEIATITTVEIGTVKSRIHRGRLAVRNALVARGWRGPAG